MEAQLLSFIPTLGFGTVACIYLWKYINKIAEESRKDTKEQIAELKEENKEDKKLFQSAIDNFGVAVQEFRSVQLETIGIKGDIKEVKQDLLIIKNKMDN